jgi:hypothetical protein
MARVVESVDPTSYAEGVHSTSACMKASTRTLHAFELFKSFHVESKASLPFTHYAFAPQATAPFATEEFPGGGADAPAVSCNNPEFPSDYYHKTYSGNAGEDDFSVTMGAVEGCASINK